jgi:hypothetical protein
MIGSKQEYEELKKEFLEFKKGIIKLDFDSFWGFIKEPDCP